MNFSRRGLAALLALPAAMSSSRGAGKLASENPASDITKDLQSQIDACNARGGGIVAIPEGRNGFTQLKLRSNVKLRGSGQRASNLVALAEPHTPAFVMAEGPVLHVSMANMSIWRGDGGSKTAFELIARSALQGKPHGGLWHSLFSDIELIGFDLGISLQGGADGYMLPHQFLSFERMAVLGNGTNSAVQLYGQVNQARFRDCMFDTLDKSETKTAVIDLGKLGEGDNSPKLTSFDQCTFQHNSLAIHARDAQSINICNSWFENNGTAILADSCLAIDVRTCRFANSGPQGVVRNIGGSEVSLEHCIFAGAKSAKPSVTEGVGKTELRSNRSIWGAGQ
ncbi:MAG: hypothetical protein IE913_07145 [Halothiobacillus sp.]|nr:hypothetical protein [Halothiobacillus sp.]